MKQRQSLCSKPSIFNNRASLEQQQHFGGKVKRWSLDLIEGSNVYTLDLQKENTYLEVHIYKNTFIVPYDFFYKAINKAFKVKDLWAKLILVFGRIHIFFQKGG